MIILEHCPQCLAMTEHHRGQCVQCHRAPHLPGHYRAPGVPVFEPTRPERSDRPRM